MKLSDIYKDNIEITKLINYLIFSFAKYSEEAAFRLTDNKIVSNIMKNMNKKSTSEGQETE